MSNTVVAKGDKKKSKSRKASKTLRNSAMSSINKGKSSKMHSSKYETM